MDLPIEAGDAPGWTPRPAGNRILVTGAAGTVATAIAAEFARTHQLVALDTAPVDSPHFTETHRGRTDDPALIEQLVARSDYVIHLATGANAGKQGLYAVEMEATNLILAAAITHGTRRVVLASSTHAAGWPERELRAGEGSGRVSPADAPRPDGLYGAAKAYVEALGRFASDWSGLPVSILRIGTMRANMTLDELIASDELPYLGRGEFREQRLRRSWLDPADLVAIVIEELAAREPYRLRYATSSPNQTEWDHRVHTGR